MTLSLSCGFTARPAASGLTRGAVRLRGGSPTASAEADIKAAIKSIVADALPAATSKEVDPYFAKYYTEAHEYIRPSGNPMDVATYKGMMLSEDIKWISDELLSIDMVKFVGGGDVSIACYTTRQKFEYKGTMNDDISKFSAVFDKTPDGWKCAHTHRCTGQPPPA